jgi:hypothetical protein
MMQFKAGDENKASSCAHFGPYKGKDFTGPGFWGLNLGSYVWDQQEHLIKFEWKKREDKAWQLTLTVDDRRVWSFATKHEGILDVGDRGGEGFKQGQPGDPAMLFQRAFDDSWHGLHVIINLAKGGRPFGRNADAALKSAELVVRGARVYA